MITALAEPANAPFAVALAVMAAIALLEGGGALLGIAFSKAVDAMLPDALSGPDGAEPTVPDGGDGLPHVVSEALGWLRIGEVPFLIFLIVALTTFGVAGLVLQGVVAGIVGAPLPGWIASMPALAVSTPVVRWVVGGLARLTPRVETSAVSRDAFVGRIATVVAGEARPGAPAQAKLTDRHGQTHYVLIEPDLEGERFGAGDPALLVSMHGAVFRAIHPPSGALMDHLHNDPGRAA